NECHRRTLGLQTASQSKSHVRLALTGEGPEDDARALPIGLARLSKASRLRSAPRHAQATFAINAAVVPSAALKSTGAIAPQSPSSVKVVGDVAPKQLVKLTIPLIENVLLSRICPAVADPCTTKAIPPMIWKDPPTDPLLRKRFMLMVAGRAGANGHLIEPVP